MALSHLPAFLTSAFDELAHWLDKRSAARLPLLLSGILFARDRRTVTSWLRVCGITAEFLAANATFRIRPRRAFVSGPPSIAS